MSIEAQKLDAVSFSINIDGMPQSPVQFRWKEGELYLACEGILLSDERIWYEVPVRDLRNIIFEEGRPSRLTLEIENGRVVIASDNKERLMALRHLILPLVSNE